MKKIKLAIIGLGYWGPNLVRNFSRHEGFEVIVGCDLLDTNLEKIRKEFPFIHLTKKIENVLNNPEVDLVAIATPPETHYSLAKKGLESNKHIWIEKPFTTRHKDANELLIIAKKKKLYIHVDFPFIFYGPVQKMKEIIDSGDIGKPFYYDSIRTNLGLIQKGVDVVWDLVPHDLSILFYLFPHLKTGPVHMQGSSHILHNPQKQIAYVTMQGTNNFAAYMHVSWISPVKIRMITIGGTKKMIVFDDIHPTEKVKVYDKNVKMKKTEITSFKPIYRSGDIWIPQYDQTEALYKEIDFLSQKLSERTFNYFTAEIGIKMLNILEKI